MDTCCKANVEFDNDVNEILARHEISFDQNPHTHILLVLTLQKTTLITISKGIAQWHRWLAKFCRPLIWDEFTNAIQLQFGPTDYEDPSEALTLLKQTTTIAVYQEAFERLSHIVDNLPENFLIGCFIAGLRDDIHIDVKIKQLGTLVDTIGVARLLRNTINYRR
uniref:Retrotransposon gag domain-containing protein n=1 Tax=Populus alba TaxID=43335 RepID=A0A4U5NQ89_POPAL|nr:hypothetical protein D5086_0000250150 [Populus alba]